MDEISSFGDDSPAIQHDSLAPIIAAAGLFRAGTPTPAITPPFPQITLPTISPAENMTTTLTSGLPLTNLFQGADTPVWEGPLIPDSGLNTSDSFFDDEELGVMDELLEVNNEIPTEELDTECTLTL